MGAARRKDIARHRLLDSPSGIAFLRSVDELLGAGYSVTPLEAAEGYHLFKLHGERGEGAVVEAPGVVNGSVREYLVEFHRPVLTIDGPAINRVRVMIHLPEPALYAEAGISAPPASDTTWWKLERMRVAEELDYVAVRTDPIANASNGGAMPSIML